MYLDLMFIRVRACRALAAFALAVPALTVLEQLGGVGLQVGQAALGRAAQQGGERVGNLGVEGEGIGRDDPQAFAGEQVEVRRRLRVLDLRALEWDLRQSAHDPRAAG